MTDVAAPISPAGLDIVALQAMLDGQQPAIRTGELHARLISGGRSNLTYLVEDDVHRWVLRRPPLGHVLETAHDMSREYRVMQALAASDVPVPAMKLICADPAVLGAPFYLMEFVDGVIFRDAGQLQALDRAQAAALGDGLMNTLATLHAVEPESVGLGQFGRAEGYLSRQVARWAKQLAASKSRELPGMDALAERLAARVPSSLRATIVHGDYRVDNVVTAHDDPGRVIAVLDWEMATLGDPLTDLASAVMWWDGISGLNSPVAAVPGEYPAFAPSSTLVERYGQLTGADLVDFDWYLGFAYYKVAAIFEGIHYRDELGLTVGEGFSGLGGLVGELVNRGHQALEGSR